MKKICAWCQKTLDHDSLGDHPENLVTHGICRNCARGVFADLGRRDFAEFLDNLEAPVIVIDERGACKTANMKARKFLHKDLKEIEDKPGGDVFECAFAKLAGGCGKTTHCDGCTIRRTVMSTLSTGRSNHRVPAYLYRGKPDDYTRVDFLITTEKINDIVLLRIDKVSNNSEVSDHS